MVNIFSYFKLQRTRALLQAFLATIIWASSFVFVKILLPDIGPLMIAGFRYFFAFLILLPFILRQSESLKNLSGQTWLILVLIGVSAYTVGNGALFWGLQYVSATTTSFLMGLSPLIILFTGSIFLKEVPSWMQIMGVIISLVGNLLYFSGGLDASEFLGLGIIGIGLIGFSVFSILGRKVARTGELKTLILTGVPLGVGGALLFLIGIPLEGWPIFDLKMILILVWLAAVNTAAAYLIYNHALKSLTALEMNVMLNLSPLGTGLLAWIMLNEKLDSLQVVGMVVAIMGVTLVQARKNVAAE